LPRIVKVNCHNVKDAYMAGPVVWGFLMDLGGAPPIATYWIAVVCIAAQAATACVRWLRGS
jgi:hypothetical protein